MWLWVCLWMVVLHVWFGVWSGVYVSLSETDIGHSAECGAAMAGAVRHLTSLTTLEYV
jgi:hypothetical protein